MKTFQTILFFFAIFTFHTALAQVQNGSFETADLGPTLEHWDTVCGGDSTHFGGSPMGGEWCLKKVSGNTQGCFPGLVFQLLPDIEDGETWQLTGWARQDDTFLPWSSTRIGFVVIPEVSIGTPWYWDANSYIVAMDSTNATTWDMLSTTHTFELSSGQIVGVVLEAGLTGGPALGISYFDDIQMEQMQNVGVNPILSDTPAIRVSNNPVLQGTPIQFADLQPEYQYTFSLFNLNGQLLKSEPIQHQSQYRLSSEALPKGIYVYQFLNENGDHHYGKLVVQ